MVITRRSTEMKNNSFDSTSTRGGVDLLERTVSVSYDDYLTTVPAEEIKKDNKEENRFKVEAIST